MDRERLKGNLDLLLLSVLSSGPAHGYAIISALRDRSGGTFDLPERAPSTPAWHRLEDPCLLASTWAQAEGRRRRVYGLTDLGAAALAAQQTEWRKFAGGVHAVLGWAAQAGWPPAACSGPGRAGVVGMTVTAPDLIAGYLAELRAGLWVPAAEAELILAEAEDHLRETAAAGLAVGMTELEAQQAAISSFGPVRAVIRAHRRRTVTAGDAAMAAWKLTGLLAATVGAGGLAAVFLLHSPLVWATGVRVVQDGPGVCQCSISMVPITGPAVMALPFAAMAAGGLALLATRQLAARRLARRGTSGRDPLSPAVTASFFLLVTALLFALNVSGVGAVTQPVDSWTTPISSGSITTTVPLVPGAIVAGCLAVAAGYGLQTALRLARRGPGSGAPALPGRDPLSPAVTASFFLLVSALLFALDVSGVGGSPSRAWLSIPLSSGSTTTTAPLVPGAVVAGCLAVAAGYGLQAALRLARRGPGSGAPALLRSGSG